MKISDYERGDHNCVEHAYLSIAEPETWRCSICIRRVPKPVSMTSQYEKHFDELNEWFKVERRKYRLYADDYPMMAEWSSVCPECRRYIRKYQSWVVELLESWVEVLYEPDTIVWHRSSDTAHYISGRFVHFNCYLEILRRQPCVYCGETPAGTVDHVVPHYNGGEDAPYNLVAACRSCNSSKGTRNQTTYILNKAMGTAEPDQGLVA